MLIKITYLIFVLCLIGCSSSQHQVVQQKIDPEAGWPERFKSSNISFDLLVGGHSIQLLVEGKGVYDGRPTADPFAGPDTVTIKKPCDVIDVDIVVGEEYYSSTFDLQNGHYFIINYFNDKLVVLQDKDAPYYD